MGGLVFGEPSRSLDIKLKAGLEIGEKPVVKASYVEGETIVNMPFTVTPEDVCAAILVANRIGGEESNEEIN